MEDICYEQRNGLKLDALIRNLETKCLIVKKPEEQFQGKLAEKKCSFENASKTSSGYSDEESSDDESKCSHENILNEQESEKNAHIETFENFYSFVDDKVIKTSFVSNQLENVTSLPLYLPSEQIKIANDLNFSWKSLCENHDGDIKTYLHGLKLNQNNIHVVFKMLLEMEDLTCMTEYVPFVQKDVVLNYTDTEYWIQLNGCPNIEDIVTPFIDEVVLVPKKSTQISEMTPFKFKTDILLPHKHEQRTLAIYQRHIAVVRSITKKRAYFRFSENEHLLKTQKDQLSVRKYDAIFRSQRHPLRYQHNAIELLSQNEEIRRYLFPIENPYKDLVCFPQPELILFNKSIASNPEQLMAVQHIRLGLNIYAPFVIFGPPGTGKTTTIVESILQLRLHNPASRIIVTAGSNSACDTIALRICKYFDTEKRLQQLEYNDPFSRESIIRIYSKSIVEKGIKSIDPVLLKYSNCADGHHQYPSIEEIHQYPIIVATLCTVGKLRTWNLGVCNLFTHIFMDEAGASSIPESLVGIMGIKSHANCRLILSGDHKQLGPVVKSEPAAKLGLKHSLMEHLLNNDCYAMDEYCNYDCTLQARLRRNFRSHPEIVRLYNHLYYKNELIAEAKAEHVNFATKWCKLPNSKFPIIFQAVHGVTEKDNVTPSSYNNLEIEVVMWFLRRLLNDGIDGKKVKETDIGIITPYKLQSKHIQNRLNSRGWRKVETGSVETFQGREKEIIIVSLVRSFSGLGFVSNPKRLNVLLSRPKCLLILIGNPLTLRRNSDFAFILDECKRHGTFLRKNKTRK